MAGLAYDKNGNLTAMERRDEAGALIDALGYDYAAGTNRLSGVTDAVAATEATWDAETGTFGYDPNGNITSFDFGGALSYTATYDETDRPVEVVRSDIAAPIRYRYAADGRRYYEEWSGSVTFHVLDGSSSLGVFARDPYTGVWIPVTWNVVAPSGQVVGREEGRPGLAGARLYYHTDHLGSVRAGVGPPSGQGRSGDGGVGRRRTTTVRAPDAVAARGGGWWGRWRTTPGTSTTGRRGGSTRERGTTCRPSEGGRALIRSPTSSPRGRPTTMF